MAGEANARAGVALALAGFLAASAWLNYYAHKLESKQEEASRTEVGAALRGQPAPDFTLPVLQPSASTAASPTPAAGEITLAAYRGQIVIISFWASWCRPCQLELPVLNQFYLANRDKGVVVLGVSTDEDRADAERYAAQNRYAIPMVWDGEGRISNLYQVESLPTMVVIDRDGKLRQYEVGLRFDLESWLDRQVKALTPKEKAAAGAS